MTLSWDVPSKATEPVLGKLSQPVDGYVVQARDLSLGDGDLEFVNYTSLLSVGTTTARVTGLHPGKQYEVRVLVVNVAGSTPSRSVFITTNASGEINGRERLTNYSHCKQVIAIQHLASV